MNPHFFTAPFYFAFIWFRVQVEASPPFLDDGILVSQPSPLGNAIKVSNPHFKWGFIWNPSGVLY